MINFVVTRNSWRDKKFRIYGDLAQEFSIDFFSGVYITVEEMYVIILNEHVSSIMETLVEAGFTVEEK